VPYGTRAVEVAVSRPFLDLRLSIDESVEPEVVRASGQRIAARLAVVNNTTGPVREAVVDMALTGAALDERTVEVSDGVYRSADNVVHWDHTTAEDLEEIGPGETVWLGFGFQPQPLASRSTVFVNPEIVVDAEAVGRRVFDDNVPEQLVAKLFKKIKILTQVRVDVAVAHVTGPNPPQVDRASVLRLTWTLSNTSSDVESGVVYAVLPPLVDWKAPATQEDVTYDASSRRVTWRLGDVAGGTGYGRDARQASFDVTVVPSVSFEGEVLPLLGDTEFLGNDTFAGAETEAGADDIATDELAGNDGKIQPAE
jgi:hypothetical protein